MARTQVGINTWKDVQTFLAAPVMSGASIGAASIPGSALAAGAAVANLGYAPAHAGANADITSLSALSTALSIGQGGTGSGTQNFVDLSTDQATIAGAKTWTGKNVFKNAEFTADSNIALDSGGAFEYKRGFGHILDGFGADFIAWYLGGFNPTSSPSSIIWTMAAATYAMKGLIVSLDSTSALNINCLTTVTNNDVTISNGHFNLTNTTIMEVTSGGTWLSFQGGPYADFGIHGASSGNMQIFRTAPAGDTVVFPKNVGFPSASTVAPSGTTQTLDFMSGTTQTVDLASASGDVTLTLSNGTPGGRYKIVAIQGATPRQLVWPVSVIWLDAAPPQVSTVNASQTIINAYYDGTNYYASRDGSQQAGAKVTVAVDHSTGVDRSAAYTNGDFSAAPFLTIQSALAALPASSAFRRLVVVNANASAYAGFNASGFGGAGDLVIKFGTAVPTLTGPTSGAAGSGSTSTTCNLPTGAGTDWTTDTLRGLFVQVASTDADLPYVRPIVSKTNTSFTFDAILGFTSGTAFTIVKAGTSLAAGSAYAGFNIGGVLTQNSSVIHTLYAAPAASLDYGIYSVANAYVDHHGAQLKAAATYQTVYSNADLYSVLNDCYMSAGNSLQQNGSTAEFQNVVSDGGYAVVQANSVLVQADMASVTAGIPLTVRRSNNALVGFKAFNCTASTAILFDSCTTVLQQNAGLTGSGNSGYGAEFVNGGQYNVVGASITGASGDFSIDGATNGLQSWATLASQKAMSRYGGGLTLLGGSGTAELLILEGLRIAGNNFDIDGAQEQHGGRVINYGFFHSATGKLGGGSADGLAALGGGGAAGATLCGLGITVFTTVSLDHDSGILNNAVIGGLWQIVINRGDHILDIYPPTGGNIDAVGLNTPVSIPANKAVIFLSRDDGSGGLNYVAIGAESLLGL